MSSFLPEGGCYELLTVIGMRRHRPYSPALLLQGLLQLSQQPQMCVQQRLSAS